MLAFIATIDAHFGKYFTCAELMEEGIDINTKLASIMKKAIDAFGRVNRIVIIITINYFIIIHFYLYKFIITGP